MMTSRIDEILSAMHRLEDDLSQEIKNYKESLKNDFDQTRNRFEREVLEQQKRFKMGVIRYVFSANIRSILATPVIYSLILPFMMLDVFVSLYQWVCFPLFKIQKVRRRDYIVFDREHLAYLNLIEKMNCAYCSYANGLIAYVREIAGKTEQYWCPIKHAKRMYYTHPYYRNFKEFGDAQAYREELKSLREKMGRD